MKPRTAQRKWKQYDEDEEKKLPTKKVPVRRGPKPKLTQEHTDFLISHLEENPTTTVVDSMESLYKEFSGLKISKTAVHKHIKEECCFSLKLAKKIIDKRNEELTLEARRNFALEWIRKEEDFVTKSIFIDEAGFHMHMIRNLAWSRKGEPANVSVPMERKTSLTVFGAISLYRIVSMAVRLPKTTVSVSIGVFSTKCLKSGS